MDSSDNGGLNAVRVNAMCNALRKQRDVQADEVVNLVGTLAEKEAEIVELKAELEKFKEPKAP